MMKIANVLLGSNIIILFIYLLFIDLILLAFESLFWYHVQV